MTSRHLLGACLILAAVACAGGKEGSTTIEPTSPGELKLRLQRSTTSQVPAAAESALVRVFNKGTGFNSVKGLAIPAPGATTEVTFNVSSGTGYSVAVIAYAFGEGAHTYRYALAGGRADNIDVRADSTTSVSINAVPWTVAVSGPDTARSGAVVTYSATVAGGPVEDFFADSYLHVALTPSEMDFPAPAGTRIGASRNGAQVSATFTAPTVSADSAMYMGVELSTPSNGWQFGNNGPLYLLIPSRMLGEEPVRRVLKVPSGGISVSF